MRLTLNTMANQCQGISHERMSRARLAKRNRAARITASRGAPIGETLLSFVRSMPREPRADDHLFDSAAKDRKTLHARSAAARSPASSTQEDELIRMRWLALALLCTATTAVSAQGTKPDSGKAKKAVTNTKVAVDKGAKDTKNE